MDIWELVILGLLILAAGTWSAYERWRAQERMGAVAILLASWGVGLLRFGWPAFLFLVPDAASLPSLVVLPLTFMVLLAIGGVLLMVSFWQTIRAAFRRGA